MSTHLSIVPLADFETMPARTLAELPRHGLNRADRAWRLQNFADAKWWEQVWINAEITIEKRLDGASHV